MLQEPVLKLPDLTKPSILRIDASWVWVAAVLMPENEGKLYPVGYASKKLALQNTTKKAKYPVIGVPGQQVVYSPGRPQTPKVYEGCCLSDQLMGNGSTEIFSLCVEDISGKKNIGENWIFVIRDIHVDQYRHIGIRVWPVNCFKDARKSQALLICCNFFLT